MSLPRFFSRIADATLPLLGDIDREILRSRLEATTVRLHAREDVADEKSLSEGFLFAANLLSRLYPRIVIDAPSTLATDAQELMRSINPGIDLDGEAAYSLAFSLEPPEGAGASVSAAGWNVVVDGATSGRPTAPAPAAALAAAAVGVGELFRSVFSDVIDRGKTQPQPGSFNLVTLDGWSDVGLPKKFDVGTVHLAGAGAIGEAAVTALRATEVEGQLFVVDPESIEESNLQRYVLALDTDEGEYKTALVGRALENTKIQVVEVPTPWGADERSAPGQAVVLTALDTADARIEVQAGLHSHIYNAYTQPTDLGWSRHENFGREPCLACLYWPEGQRPHQYQLMSSTFQQPELRVRWYLATGAPVGFPPPQNVELPTVLVPPTTEELQRWSTTPILEDIGAIFGMNPTSLDEWKGRSIDELYRDGICGGAIVRLRTESNARDLLVPLAHQSAMAGIMLAVQVLVASDENLRMLRPRQVEGRYNVLRGVPTTVAIPTFRTAMCICSDDDFRNVFEAHIGEGHSHE